MSEGIRGLPDGYEPIIGEMTNFDCSITPGLNDKLKSGKFFVHHAAWEFHGIVWFEDGTFHEQVWRYHVPLAHVTALSLEELMENVNNEYGWD